MARGIKKGKWDGITHKPLIHSSSLQGLAAASPQRLKGHSLLLHVSRHPPLEHQLAACAEQQ